MNESPLESIPPEELTAGDAFQRILAAIDEGNKRELSRYGKKQERIGPRASSYHPCLQKMLLDILHWEQEPPKSEESKKSFRGGEFGHIIVPEKIGPWLRRLGFFIQQDADEENVLIYDHDETRLISGHIDNQITNRHYRTVAEIKTASLERVKAINSWRDFTRWWELGYRAQLLLYMTAKKGGYWEQLPPPNYGTAFFSSPRCDECEQQIKEGSVVLRILGCDDLNCEECGLKRGYEQAMWILTDCRKEFKAIPIELDPENREYVRTILAELRQVVRALERVKAGESNSLPLAAKPIYCRTCWHRDIGTCDGATANLQGVPVIMDEDITERFDRAADIADVGREYIQFLNWAKKHIKEPYRDSAAEHLIVGNHSVAFTRSKKTVKDFPPDVLERRKSEEQQYSTSIDDGKLSMNIEFASDVDDASDSIDQETNND